MSEEIQEKIDELGAAGIKRVRGDEGEVEGMSISELLLAKNASATDAALEQDHGGIRFRKIRPPGAG